MKQLKHLKYINGIMLAALALLAMPAAAMATTNLMMGGEEPAKVAAKSYPATLLGERTGEWEMRLLSTAKGNLRCENGTFESQPYSAATESVTLSASYSSCSMVGLGAATVKMNGCQYQFTKQPASEEAKFPAAGKIICESGHSIEASGGGCTLSIPAQPFGTANLSNAYGGGILVFANAENLEFTASNTFGCQLGGFGTGHQTGGLAYSNLLLKGGFLTTPARLEASSYPTTVSGSRITAGYTNTKIVPLEAEGIKMSCKEVALSGGELGAAASSLSFVPSYSECSWEIPLGTSAGSVNMNGCYYRSTGLRWQPEIAGQYQDVAEIVCSGGNELKLTINGTGCTISVPPQQLLSNSPEAGLANIQVEGVGQLLGVIKSSSVKYTVPKSYGCNTLTGLSAGTHETGSLETDMQLKAS